MILLMTCQVPDELASMPVELACPKTGKTLMCYAERIAVVGGERYLVAFPKDPAVAIAFDESGEVSPVPNDDPIMDELFPLAEACAADLGPGVTLLRYDDPYILIRRGGLKKELNLKSVLEDTSRVVVVLTAVSSYVRSGRDTCSGCCIACRRACSLLNGIPQGCGSATARPCVWNLLGDFDVSYVSPLMTGEIK